MGRGPTSGWRSAGMTTPGVASVWAHEWPNRRRIDRYILLTNRVGAEDGCGHRHAKDRDTADNQPLPSDWQFATELDHGGTSRVGAGHDGEHLRQIELIDVGVSPPT